MTTGVRGLAPSIGDPVQSLIRCRCSLAWPVSPCGEGRSGAAQAERLLWRAGFGPRPGEAQKLARLGLEGAVHKLTHPGREHFVGHRPHDEKGRPLAPFDAWGHDHVWWLDRMVRTSRPLVERMTLIWHDWFATSNNGVGSQRLMLNQNQLFRRHGLGSFHELLLDVTKDPAMLLWLNGSDNSKDSPNENYAREMMELFTLGADRGYTESDVRQQARALTGFRNSWSQNSGPVNFRYDPSYHDPGVKTIFHHRGRFTWKDSCRLCVTHPDHAVVLRPEALELLRPRAAGPRHAARARAALQDARSTRCGPSSPRSCATPRSTRARGW